MGLNYTFVQIAKKFYCLTGGTKISNLLDLLRIYDTGRWAWDLMCVAEIGL